MIKLHHPKSIGLLILITLLSTGIGFSQDNVLLKIVDIQSGEPIENVKARVKGYPEEYITNRLGYLELKNLQQRNASLTLSHEAYLSGEISISESTSKLVVKMERNYLDLGEIIVIESPDLHLSQVRSQGNMKLTRYLAAWTKQEEAISNAILSTVGDIIIGQKIEVSFKLGMEDQISQLQLTGVDPQYSQKFEGMMERLEEQLVKLNDSLNVDSFFRFGIGSELLTQPWIVTDEPPVPPGGHKFDELLRTSIKFPEEAKRQNFQGVVKVSFIINEDGSLSNFAVHEPRGMGCDEEAIRAIKSFGNWKPGKIRGVPVKVIKQYPVYFAQQYIPRGMGFRGYLNSLTNFPQHAIQNGIEGRLYLSFHYDQKTKKVSQLKVINDLGYGCGEAALKAFKEAPRSLLEKDLNTSGTFLWPFQFLMSGSDRLEREKALPVKGALLLADIYVTGHYITYDSKLDSYVVEGNLNTIAETIERSPNANTLNLQHKKLLELDDQIVKLEKLTVLNLEGNYLSTLPEELYEVEGLTELYLNDNRIDYLPDGISKLKGLRTLGIGYNQLSELPEEIWELTRLQMLDIRGLNIKELPSMISNLKNLEVLVLDDNPISELPDELLKLKLLKEIHLARTSFLSSEIELVKKKFKDVTIVFY